MRKLKKKYVYIFYLYGKYFTTGYWMAQRNDAHEKRIVYRTIMDEYRFAFFSFWIFIIYFVLNNIIYFRFSLKLQITPILLLLVYYYGRAFRHSKYVYEHIYFYFSWIIIWKKYISPCFYICVCNQQEQIFEESDENSNTSDNLIMRAIFRVVYRISRYS